MTTKEMIEVLQAFNDGKEILGSTRGHSVWHTIGDKEHLFNFENNTYRIKPEPSMEELISKWVKKQEANEGDFVSFEGDKKEYKIYHIRKHSIVLENGLPNTISIKDSNLLKKMFLSKRILTRAEITKKWVEDNKIKVGSRVKVVKKVIQEDLMWPCQMDDCIGGIYTVKSIYNTSIYLSEWFLPVESLEPYKEQWVPFTLEDYELFMGKIITNNINNYIIIGFNESDITTQRSNYTYARAFELFKFIDGTPFGKQL